MRERQQMASRPFASIAVALEVGGDQEELLQVSTRQTTQHRQKQTAKDGTHEHKREVRVLCFGKKTQHSLGWYAYLHFHTST